MFGAVISNTRSPFHSDSEGECGLGRRVSCPQSAAKIVCGVGRNNTVFHRQHKWDFDSALADQLGDFFVRFGDDVDSTAGVVCAVIPKICAFAQPQRRIDCAEGSARSDTTIGAKLDSLGDEFRAVMAPKAPPMEVRSVA